MIPDLLLHPQTAQSIELFIAQPSHAFILVGPAGIGKQSLSRAMAGRLLEVELAKLENQPYLRIIGPGKDRSITIDKVRELEEFLSRKVPGGGKRVIIIDDAHLLGTEAQNALLKTLEEPPENTTLLLTVAHEQALLPTVRSRAQTLSILRPESEALLSHFKAGHDETAVNRAYAMSGGLPGLMTAILQNEQEHPLVQAAGMARQIAGGTMFDRLALVEGLSKDREQCLQVLTVLQQMARLSLRSGKGTTSWQKILTASHTAIGELLGSGQPKLVLTNLMLNL